VGAWRGGGAAAAVDAVDHLFGREVAGHGPTLRARSGTAGQAAWHAGSMRVVAGEARGRTLIAPKGKDNPPTADRVREAVFNALNSSTGSRVRPCSTVRRFGCARHRGALAGRRPRHLRRQGPHGTGGGAGQPRKPPGWRQGHGPPGDADDVRRAGGRSCVARSALRAGRRRLDGGARADRRPTSSWSSRTGWWSSRTGWRVLRSKRYGGTVVADRPPGRSPGRTTIPVTTVLYPGSFDPFHNGHREPRRDSSVPVRPG